MLLNMYKKHTYCILVSFLNREDARSLPGKKHIHGADPRSSRFSKRSHALDELTERNGLKDAMQCTSRSTSSSTSSTVENLRVLSRSYYRPTHFWSMTEGADQWSIKIRPPADVLRSAGRRLRTPASALV